MFGCMVTDFGPFKQLDFCDFVCGLDVICEGEEGRAYATNSSRETFSWKHF